MDVIVDFAERTLLEHPHPALRLSELHQHITDGLDRSLTVDRLRLILEDHTELFRILDLWTGRWALDQSDADPWVVLVSEPRNTPASEPDAVATLRESVRWLARGVDSRSRASVARWCSMALAERAAHEALLRRAA